MTFVASTNVYTTKNLTTCKYKQYVGYSAVEFTVGQAYSGITLYYFMIGLIKNPSSVIFPDSF